MPSKSHNDKGKVIMCSPGFPSSGQSLVKFPLESSFSGENVRTDPVGCSLSVEEK